MNVTSSHSLTKETCISLIGHGLVCLMFFLFQHMHAFEPVRKIDASTVVWTQTVKRPNPTIEDKLPAPLVPRELPEEKEDPGINLNKAQPLKKTKPIEKKPSKDELMKKALALMSVTRDDRPVPKEDNFPDQTTPVKEGLLSDQQINALEATSTYTKYILLIKQLIQSNYIWYNAQKNVVALISIKLAPDGQILNPHLEKSSGNTSFDQATLRAVHKSNPLPPPPLELTQMFKQESININFRGDEL